MYVMQFISPVWNILKERFLIQSFRLVTFSLLRRKTSGVECRNCCKKKILFKVISLSLSLLFKRTM